MIWSESKVGFGAFCLATVLTVAILMAASVKGCQISADKRVAYFGAVTEVCNVNPDTCDAAIVMIEDAAY